MSKITRGKWNWKLSADTIDFYVDGKPLHPTLADAELICSAPELYDMLSELVYLHFEKVKDIKGDPCEVKFYKALRRQEDIFFQAQEVIERIKERSTNNDC